MRFVDSIEVKQNLFITARERGKIVGKREGHNIWLNIGREYLAQLIAYASFGPDVPFRNDRIKYMGFGIGGTRQLVPDSSMLVDVKNDHPGSNTQTDTDATVTALERPVRVAGSSTATPGTAGDDWIGIIGDDDPFTVPTEVKFTRVFAALELSYTPYLTVPLSEIGLFTQLADPEIFNNTPVAYDTFDTLSKTSAVSIEVEWTIKF